MVWYASVQNVSMGGIKRGIVLIKLLVGEEHIMWLHFYNIDVGSTSFYPYRFILNPSYFEFSFLSLHQQFGNKIFSSQMREK